ncbi:uncharacterized protein N7503_002467 [Penicillium pulvis]|uniref:uncharacterized protein n=1 Tax=Penicillium pulvis TaxID=1562058 RepID=UPI00254743C8|nr:uncharacterized protein N7503_002467 [Penicillium pulvis]KAJ5810249.1 hypothetical protein N7503_002467 [Penicillium pulvis]
MFSVPCKQPAPQSASYQTNRGDEIWGPTTTTRSTPLEPRLSAPDTAVVEAFPLHYSPLASLTHSFLALVVHPLLPEV